jgi:hypothetical protein
MFTKASITISSILRKRYSRRWKLGWLIKAAINVHQAGGDGDYTVCNCADLIGSPSLLAHLGLVVSKHVAAHHLSVSDPDSMNDKVSLRLKNANFFNDLFQLLSRFIIANHLKEIGEHIQFERKGYAHQDGE